MNFALINWNRETKPLTVYKETIAPYDTATK